MYNKKSSLDTHCGDFVIHHSLEILCTTKQFLIKTVTDISTTPQHTLYMYSIYVRNVFLSLLSISYNHSSGSQPKNK